jgi:type IX secretion system PorP/SprF family membrane protein
MKLNIINTLKGMVIIITLLSTTSLKAQLSPFGAMYFQNEYLGNPAMAGSKEGLRADLGYSSQQTNMPGAPKTQVLTMGYSVKKVGLGLSLLIDQAGAFNRTRFMGTYVYNLPIDSDNGNLSFGLSLGLMKERLTDYNGDLNDASVSRFNQRPAYIDGDFGVAYKKDGITLQLALPNLKTFFGTDASNATNIVNQVKFFSAASYKFNVNSSIGSIGLEPKVVYRAVSGYNDIIDLGANANFLENKFSFMALYHSTKSMSFGFGSKLNDMFYLNAVYKTATAALNGNATGDFEVNLRVNLPHKVKK